ncbi:hypothetical protein ABZ234_08645 [Nocardiopsis sp. NPDC006198]|uniref:hypothetical protein n=1 Tax=Nocardiopsis sp. NPDC006198 TaxID=3154472 RepID=UPI0033B79206
MTDTKDLAQMRSTLRAMLADLDTLDRPAPTRHTPAGPVWEVRESLPRPSTWRVRAHEGEGGLIDWQLPESERISAATLPGDWSMLTVLDARRVAAALLAACDYAEESAQGVVALRARRRHRADSAPGDGPHGCSRPS